MFDHLDDDTPVEPSDATRAAVARRATRLRRRRAVVPGAVALVLVAVVLGVVAFAASNDDTEQIVARRGVITTDNPPVSADATIRGVLVHVVLPKSTFSPGEATTWVVQLRNQTPDAAEVHGSVCTDIDGHPVGTKGGWFGYSPAGCGTFRAASLQPDAHSTFRGAFAVPTDAGGHTLAVLVDGTRGSNGGAVTLPFRVVGGDAPAGALPARIELDTDHVVAGGELHGVVVVENPGPTTVGLREDGGCGAMWQVVLAKPFGEVPADVGWDLPCRSTLQVPPGTTRWPFTVPASSSDGALDPGVYEARFLWREPVGGITIPQPVVVTVTAATIAPTITAHLELDARRCPPAANSTAPSSSRTTPARPSRRRRVRALRSGRSRWRSRVSTPRSGSPGSAAAGRCAFPPVRAGSPSRCGRSTAAARPARRHRACRRASRTTPASRRSHRVTTKRRSPAASATTARPPGAGPGHRHRTALTDRRPTTRGGGAGG